MAGLSSGACGPRNSMKMMQSRAEWIRGGEVGETVEKSRLLDCLIRSVQDCANNWALSSHCGSNSHVTLVN